LFKNLKKPWLAALTTTLLLTLLLVGLPFAIQLIEVRDSGSESLAYLSPSAGELAVSAGFAVLTFLALWALFWLAARFRPRRSSSV